MPSLDLPKYIKLIDAPMNGKRGTLGTYLVSGKKTAVIDPGPTSQTTGILKELKALNVKSLDWVLATHIHLDHTGGSWLLLKEYPEALLHCHPKGASHMIDPSKLREGAKKLFGERILEYGEIKGVPETRMRSSVDREVIDLGGVDLAVYWTPGHSSHSQCYFEPDSKTVFVGDAVGHNVVGTPILPVSPPPHNPMQALESIELIRSLSPENLCIAHFGVYSDSDGYLDQISNRTRLWIRLAEKTIDEGMSLDDLVELVMAEDTPLTESMNVGDDAVSSLKSSLLGFYMYARWVHARA
jgi:glyoxylase-like metal-dependent hydrolase (beta-lactamase superfamily II)